jgi:hypothetical protein
LADGQYDLAGILHRLLSAVGHAFQQPAEHAERAHVNTGCSLTESVLHMHCALHRCDETNSIEAMEAMEGVSADNLLLPSPFQQGAPASSAALLRGTTLQVGWGDECSSLLVCDNTQPVCARSHVPSAAAMRTAAAAAAP